MKLVSHYTCSAVGAAVGIGTTILWRKLARVLPEYRDIKVEIIIETGLTDIVAERYDARGIGFAGLADGHINVEQALIFKHLDQMRGMLLYLTTEAEPFWCC